MPVRTGFEGVSKPARTMFENTAYCAPGPEELADFFDDDETVSPPHRWDDEASLEDLEELFDDESEDTPDEDLEGLL